MRRTWTALMVLLALGMIGVGVYVLALGQLSSSGKACGGSPLPVFMNGASPSADRLGQAGDCDREAWESVALGLSTIGIGAVMGVAAVALR